jgi:hypothetical protein
MEQPQLSDPEDTLTQWEIRETIIEKGRVCSVLNLLSSGSRELGLFRAQWLVIQRSVMSETSHVWFTVEDQV